MIEHHNDEGGDDYFEQSEDDDCPCTCEDVDFETKHYKYWRGYEEMMERHGEACNSF